MSSVQDRGASVEVKKEISSGEEVGGNVKVTKQNSLKGKMQNFGSRSTLPDEPRPLQMISIMQLPKAELMSLGTLWTSGYFCVVLITALIVQLQMIVQS